MRMTVMTALAAAMLASPAFADPAPMQPQPAVAESNPLTCHYQVHDGALITRQECHRLSEWDVFRQQQQRDVAEFQMRSLTFNRH